MFGEGTWSEPGPGGGGEDADVAAGLLGRSARLPVWVSQRAFSTGAAQRSFLSASPRSGSPPTRSPLAPLRCDSFLAWEALREGLGGGGSRVSPAAPPGQGGNSRTALTPPRVSPVAQVGSSFLSLPSKTSYQPSLLTSQAAPPADPRAASSSPTRYMLSPPPSTSRGALRLGLGIFCLLNAAIAFLFAWMMRTHQAAFAITAARRRWDPARRSDATVKAGLYYAVLATILLVNRLSSLAALLLQLVLRAVRFSMPILRRLCRWAVQKLPHPPRGPRGGTLRSYDGDDGDDDLGGRGVVADEAAPLVRARNVSQFWQSSFAGPGAAPSGSPTALSASRNMTRVSGVVGGVSTVASAQGSMRTVTPVTDTDVRVRTSPSSTPFRWRGS